MEKIKMVTKKDSWQKLKCSNELKILKHTNVNIFS
jgi:hypothetical protein